MRYLCEIVQERKKLMKRKGAKKEQKIEENHLKLDEDQLELQKIVLSHGRSRELKVKVKTTKNPASGVQED